MSLCWRLSHIGASDTLGEEVLHFSFLFFPMRYEKATPSPPAGEIALYLHSLSLFAVNTLFNSVARHRAHAFPSRNPASDAIEIHCEGRAATLTLMTQRRGEDGQRSPHNYSTAALVVSRPTLSAAQPPACSHLPTSPATIDLRPSHLRPSQQRPSHLRPSHQQPSHLWPSHQSSTAQPSKPSLQPARIQESSSILLIFFFSLVRFKLLITFDMILVLPANPASTTPRNQEDSQECECFHLFLPIYSLFFLALSLLCCVY